MVRMDIAAKGLDFQALNRQVKAASGDVCIRDSVSYTHLTLPTILLV